LAGWLYPLKKGNFGHLEQSDALKSLVNEDAHLRFFLRRSIVDLKKISRQGMGTDGYYRSLRGADHDVIPFGADASAFAIM